MKNIILVLFISLFNVFGWGTNFTIINAGTAQSPVFSPSTITITQNDNVIFTLSSFHDAVEVSLDTWNADGISPIIGFQVPFGGGTLAGSQLSVGTHYFVCENHGPMGMKGSIIVTAFSGIINHEVQDDILVYPNPAKDNISVQVDPASLKVVEIKLFNFQGKLVSVLLSKTEISGFYRQSFSLKNTTPGIYFVQILSDETTTYQKVVVQ